MKQIQPQISEPTLEDGVELNNDNIDSVLLYDSQCDGITCVNINGTDVTITVKNPSINLRKAMPHEGYQELLDKNPWQVYVACSYQGAGGLPHTSLDKAVDTEYGKTVIIPSGNPSIGRLRVSIVNEDSGFKITHITSEIPEES